METNLFFISYYKIITKTITNSLLATLIEIIPSEQLTAVPGCQIYDNRFNIGDLINCSNKKRNPRYTLSFDLLRQIETTCSGVQKK